MEERLAALEAKLDALYQAITDTELETDKEDFTNKWQDRVAEIEPLQKKVYGDEWNEMNGLFNHHRKHMNEEGYDEDKIINGYIDSIKAKFDALKQDAQTPEQVEQIEQQEEKAIEAVEDAVEQSEEIADDTEVIAEIPIDDMDASEDEIKEMLADSDFELMK